MTAPTQEGCVFCGRYLAGEYLRTEASTVMRFEPLNPVTAGHMLFMPKVHVADAAERPYLTARVFEEAAVWGQNRSEQFNLITSAGADATQTVRHLHVHYVPREHGDGLTLPWTGQVKA